jgi:hypothetical protein
MIVPDALRRIWDFSHALLGKTRMPGRRSAIGREESRQTVSDAGAQISDGVARRVPDSLEMENRGSSTRFRMSPARVRNKGLLFP